MKGNNDNDVPDTRRFFRANVPVFFGSALFIAAAVVFAAHDPDYAGLVFESVQSWIVHEMGWFYAAAVAIYLVFIVTLAVSSMGRIRLGPDDSVPDFSTRSWFAMLFSAGMGIGIMFYGVAEPLLHYATPPTGEGGTVDAARNAMQLTFFHWGLHAWAIFAVMGLALAYFSFRHGLPLTVRSALYPIIGDRIHGWTGHLVDIFAVIGTIFGVATSLGIGVLQVNAGLNYLFGIEQGPLPQLALIAGITLLATASVAAGIDAGIRRLSELNLGLAVLLLLFVLAIGPTAFLFRAFLQNTGIYLADLIERTFSLYAYEPNEWLADWTLFYWGWWISWSPFVGMFIARISRGRTIREFVVGVLLVPVGFTFLWFTVFGNTALMMQFEGSADMVSAVQSDMAVALFRFLEHLPLSSIAILLSTLLVVTFFVTSSDSGSLVIDIITTQGVSNPPVWQRVFWAIIQGVVAGVLLLAGGLTALQTGAIASGFPLAVIMLVVCFGLFRALRHERERQRTLRSIPGTAEAGVPWRRRLRVLLHHPTHDEGVRFLSDTVVPAFNEVAKEMRAGAREVDIVHGEDDECLVVRHGEDEFLYRVSLQGVPLPSFAVTVEGEREGPDRSWRAEVALREGGQGYDILGLSREQVIADLLGQYERHLHYVHRHVNE